MGLRQERVEMLAAIHSHLEKNPSISTAQLAEATGRHSATARKQLSGLARLGLLMSQGAGPTLAYVWAEAPFKTMSADELEAEVERREAAAKGKPPPRPPKPVVKKTAAKPSSGKTPAWPTGHPAHEWVQHVFDYERNRKPGQPGYWEE